MSPAARRQRRLGTGIGCCFAGQPQLEAPFELRAGAGVPIRLLAPELLAATTSLPAAEIYDEGSEAPSLCPSSDLRARVAIPLQPGNVALHKRVVPYCHHLHIARCP